MGPQHSLLCVKQAKAYLDDVLAGSWEDGVRILTPSEAERLFGNAKGFANAQREGAGIIVIQNFLGGAFAKGHGVRDALAILTSGQRKALVATEMIDEGWHDGTGRAGSLRI